MPEQARGSRKVIILPRELLDGVDAYRSQMRPIPSESEAIRQLIERGLAAADVPQTASVSRRRKPA